MYDDVIDIVDDNQRYCRTIICMLNKRTIQREGDDDASTLQQKTTASATKKRGRRAFRMLKYCKTLFF